MLQPAYNLRTLLSLFTGLHEFPQDTSTSKARLEFESVAIKAAE
jgi:hypothetical protein